MKLIDAPLKKMLLRLDVYYAGKNYFYRPNKTRVIAYYKGGPSQELGLGIFGSELVRVTKLARPTTKRRK